MVYCVIIAALVISLTGCRFKIRNILTEHSTGMNAENPNVGTWVLTSTKYFAYKDGKEQYVSKQNKYYKYRCYDRGVTEDNFAKFQVSGGLYDYNGENYTCDAYHPEYSLTGNRHTPFCTIIYMIADLAKMGRARSIEPVQNV